MPVSPELDEKKVMVLPCVAGDCAVPYFCGRKCGRFHVAKDPICQVNDALLKISNRQQGRLESPERLPTGASIGRRMTRIAGYLSGRPST
jgi:hypothetical protein